MGCGASGSSKLIESKVINDENKNEKLEAKEVIKEEHRVNDNEEKKENEAQQKNAEEPLREVITIGMIGKESSEQRTEENKQPKLQNHQGTTLFSQNPQKAKEDEKKDQEQNTNDMNTEDTQFSETIPPIKDPNWPEAKRNFILACGEIIKSNNLETSLNISITKIISINKNDYDQFSSAVNYQVTISNKVNNLQWNKKPLVQVKKAIIDLASKDSLIQLSQCFNWTKESNEYESFQSSIKLLRISKTNQDLEHFILNPEVINNKPLVILIFSLTDENSLLFLKEMLTYRKKNTSFGFIPIYGEPLENANKSLYIWEIMEKMKVTDNQLELYFVEDSKLDNCFKYLTDDNLRKINTKAIVIDHNKMIRMILPPEKFSFNIIENLNIIKNEFKQVKINMFDSLKEKNMDKTFLSTPCNVELFLKKCKVYSFIEGEAPQLYHEVLYGKIEQNEIFADKMKNVAHFIKRAPREQNKPTWKQRNDLVIQEMKNFIENVQLHGIKYCSTYHRTNKIISISKEKSQKFSILPGKTFQMTFELLNDLFEQQFQMAITSAMSIFSEYSCFGKINFLNTVPQINTPFCNKMTLINKDNRKDEDILLTDTQKPSFLIILSPYKEFLAKAELQSRLAKLDKDIDEYYEEVNVYIIYRGEVETMRDIDFLLDDSVFTRELPVYVLSSNNNTFPLYYQNNGMETEDSQFLTIITDSANKVVYVGNTDDIQIKNTFNNLIQENETQVIYKKHIPLTFDYFNSQVKPLIDEIEKIIRLEFEKEKELLYKPFIDISYNTNTKFTDTKEGDSFINNFRLRVLIKERHKEFITKSKDMKEIIKTIKSFGGFVQIIPIPCVTLEIPSECTQCNKEMEEKDPFYFNQETNALYCIDCEKTLEFIEVYLIYFKSTSFDDEIIEEYFESNVRNDQPLNPYLGALCKICKGTLGNPYYVNLTHFNVISQSSPFEPIDICQYCFSCMTDKKKRFNYFKEKTAVNILGLNSKQMIYRKIKMPQ